jgi:light-regulated signal transduction histidine kinase (bacteriophytochrome)
MPSMLPVADSAQHPGPGLARFLERVRLHSFHELRGRLGTIVNFAAVLEDGRSSGPETAAAAARIRINAMATVRMLQALGTALELAARPLRPRPTDLCSLARTILAELGLQSAVHSIDRDPIALVDPELVSFAWRAFLSMQGDSRVPGSSLSVDAALQADEGVLQLATGAPQALAGDLPETDVPSYVQHDTGPARVENALALTLAQHLVACQDGRMSLHGVPGEGSRLRLALPLSEDAGSAL